MTLESLKKYIDTQIKDMNRYIDTNPYCTKPLETINHTESRCFGAVDYAVQMTDIGFEKIDTMWMGYLEYFRNRRNEVRENERKKKNYV